MKAGDLEPLSPQLTVIVPVFNEAQTVREAVARIRAIPLRTQIICVNDGSDDESPAFLQTLKNDGEIDVLLHHPRISAELRHLLQVATLGGRLRPGNSIHVVFCNPARRVVGDRTITVNSATAARRSGPHQSLSAAGSASHRSRRATLTFVA